MMAKVTFLRVAGFRVIDEVLTLMDADTNPGSFEECRDLPEMIKDIAARLPATMKTEPWRHVTGSSGGLYPVYISETEPFIVYAAVKRNPQPDELLVMHVGLRNGRRSAVFFQDVRAEIDRRITRQGWLP